MSSESSTHQAGTGAAEASRLGRGPLKANKDLEDFELDILGQQPLMKVYTQICFCYSVADMSAFSHYAIINTLKQGLERLSASFPWVTGQVVEENAGKGKTGTMKIKPLEKTPRLVVEDFRDDPSMPDMATLKSANFPMRLLDESRICPVSTLAGDLDMLPVLVFQATFIKGGVLVTVNAEHATMDMTGQGQLIRLFDKACRDVPFTEEELYTGNLDRRGVIPLLDGDSYKDSTVLANQIVKRPPPEVASEFEASGRPARKSSWACFNFSASSLASLKSLASKTMTGEFVSTDDSLSAFIWQATTRARLLRLNATAETTFMRAVDVRQFLDLPRTYPGLVQTMTYETSTLHELANAPLGAVASKLRASLDPEALAFNTRALATAMDRSADKSVFSVTAALDQGRDIALSSWAREKSYDLDFGLGLGKPECVRRPQFAPVESLMYLMPKTKEGDIALALCLRDEDMQRLKEDSVFAKYGTYIG